MPESENTWQNVIVQSLGMAALFAIVFFVWSGARVAMGIGGLPMGFISGLAMFGGKAIQNKQQADRIRRAEEATQSETPSREEARTDEEYRRILKRYHRQALFLMPLGGVVGFCILFLLYGSPTDGLYGIAAGPLLGSFALMFISRFAGGPDSPKWKDYSEIYRAHQRRAHLN